MRTITIDVTDRDIACGKRYRAWECPVSLAAERAIGSCVGVYWSIGGIELIPENGGRYSVKSDDVRRRVLQFDDMASMEPFSFQVEIE